MNLQIKSPFPFDQLPRVWSWVSTFRGKVSDDFGPQTLEAFMEFAGTKWDQQKTWAISVDGELGGLITFERLSPWLGTAHWIFKPDFQGKGIAIKASRIAVADMFAEGIGKVAVYPLAGNLAIGSLLAALGAKREGTLIEQTVCNGKPTDMWVYGLTKAQFEGQQNAVSSSSTIDLSGNRGDQLAPRGVPLGQAEDHHNDQHDDAHTADAADHGPAPQLRG